jgi:hypothetical protein
MHECLRGLGALEFSVLGIEQVSVAGTFVACGLTGAGGNAVALPATDVAVLVANLVPPVLCAASLARRWTICTRKILDRPEIHMVNLI